MLLTAASTPVEITEALWEVYNHEQRKGRWLAPFTRTQFLRGVLPLAYDFADGLFDGLARDDAIIFVRHLQRITPRMPWGWLKLFEASFTNGHMTALCWGAVSRLIFLSAAPPSGARYEDHLTILPSLRRAPPESFMSREQLASLRSLNVPLYAYRAAPAGMHFEAAFGIDWCLSIEKAAQRAYHLHNLGGFLPVAPLRFGEKLTMVKALIPVEAVFSWHHEIEDQPCDMLVDCLAVPMATVTQLNMPDEFSMFMKQVRHAMPVVTTLLIQQSESAT
jgi:hypothetical protein